MPRIEIQLLSDYSFSMWLHRNEYGFNYLLDNEAIVGIFELRFLFFFLDYVAQ